MRLYLDLNCFNRPFDDQSQERVAREAEAVLIVLARVLVGSDDLLWSEALSVENSYHPVSERRAEVATWERRAVEVVEVSTDVYRRANQLASVGLTPFDALHLACAEAGECEVFLTCDDRLLRRSGRIELVVEVTTPVQYLERYGAS